MMYDLGLWDGFWFKFGALLGELAWAFAILFVSFIFVVISEFKVYWRNRGQKND